MQRAYTFQSVVAYLICCDGYNLIKPHLVLPRWGSSFFIIIITNDYERAVELLVGDYSRRWRVENCIAEAVKFFHLNALSSPILVKVHFDVLLTVVADTLYYLLAQKLRRFEDCDAPRIFRHFVKGKGTIKITDTDILVTYWKPRFHVADPARGVSADTCATELLQTDDVNRMIDHGRVTENRCQLYAGTHYR